MRFVTLTLILAASVVTQSCRIEMPSTVDLLSKYGPYIEISLNSRLGLYDFKASQAITLQGGFKDTLVIGDIPSTHHANAMLSIMGSMGIFEDENIVIFEPFTNGGAIHGSRAFARGNIGLEVFTSGKYETLRKATRVVHLPLSTPLRAPQDPPRVQAGDILFVIGSANVRDYFEGDRDMYNSRHIQWSDPNPERDTQKKMAYQNLLDVYNTGKAIAATSARVTEKGTIEPFDFVVPCGDIKEACFTVIPQQATSLASARLAAMTFYLSQFWETPEEVVETLNVCAIDIGESGIDREYGRGIANLLCPRVLKKEIEVVSSHLEKKKVGESAQGGMLQGLWEADKLQVYIPAALQQTLSVDYTGEVSGTVEFTEEEVTADFKAEALVKATFLLPIEARAEEVINTKGTYTVTDSLLTLQGAKKPFVYTATKDSLHLLQLYTLNEALALLPNPLGSMVNMASEDFFVDDPLQMRMSFVKKLKLIGDFNEDTIVDFADFLLFVATFGSSEGDREFNRLMDLAPDGTINFADFLIFVNQFGKTRNS